MRDSPRLVERHSDNMVEVASPVTQGSTLDRSWRPSDTPQQDPLPAQVLQRDGMPVVVRE